MSSVVREILERIVRLPEAERAELQGELSRMEEEEWLGLLAKASQSARERGIDDAAIARAVESSRYGDDDHAR